MSIEREALSFNILFLRAQRQLSQVELAKKARISRTIVSFIENGEGNPTLGHLEKIATALGVTVRDLFTPKGASLKGDPYVDADCFMVAIDDRKRYSKRGRPKRGSSAS